MPKLMRKCQQQKFAPIKAYLTNISMNVTKKYLLAILELRAKTDKKCIPTISFHFMRIAEHTLLGSFDQFGPLISLCHPVTSVFCMITNNLCKSLTYECSNSETFLF